MASPMVEGRVDPHKKAQYTLHISDQIADGEVGDFTSIRYNHKPAQSTSSRTTRITSTSPKSYNLKILDQKAGDNKDVFIFTGQKTEVPKKSYILLFDPATQKATLEPLASTYTFNVSTKNGNDMSSTYPKIYPRKQNDDVSDASAAGGGDELFKDDASRDDVSIAADPDNPFDFRHFLKQGSEGKKGDESEYGVTSPDHRAGTGSAMNTPQVAAARKPATSNLSSKTKLASQVAPKPKKRRSPEPEGKKPVVKKAPPPTVRLERRATTVPKGTKSAAPKPKPAKKSAAAAPPASKIKSAEIVHSSDEESDEDADGSPDLAPVTAPIYSSPPPAQRSPSPPSQQHHRTNDPASDEDEDEEMEDVGTGGGGLDLELEFEIPDAAPSRPKHPLRQNLGYLASPANGPISLASAASSVEGTPRRNRAVNALENDEGVIDFGDMNGGASDDEDAEGELDDHDVPDMDIGPPAHVDIDMDAEVEEEDPLYKEMMEGLAGGDSSEESEEE